MKRIGIVAKTDRDEARTVLPQILDWCGDLGAVQAGGAVRRNGDYAAAEREYREAEQLLDQAERYLAGQDFELVRAERDVVTLD